MNDDKDQLAVLIGNTYSDIYNLDLVIERYAYALEIIQPSVTGKIAVRFLKRRWGGKEGRHPQIIQWYKSTNDRYLYNRLDTNEVLKKVKKYPVFAPVEQDVKTLLREVIDLMNHREAQLAAINNFKRQLASMCSRSFKYTAERKEQILEWLPQLNARREVLLKSWAEAVKSAHYELPDEAVPNPVSRPRTDLTGRTRSKIPKAR